MVGHAGSLPSPDSLHVGWPRARLDPQLSRRAGPMESTRSTDARGYAAAGSAAAPTDCCVRIGCRSRRSGAHSTPRGLPFLLRCPRQGERMMKSRRVHLSASLVAILFLASSAPKISAHQNLAPVLLRRQPLGFRKSFHCLSRDLAAAVRAGSGRPVRRWGVALQQRRDLGGAARGDAAQPEKRNAGAARGRPVHQLRGRPCPRAARGTGVSGLRSRHADRQVSRRLPWRRAARGHVCDLDRRQRPQRCAQRICE